uniref:peptidase U32 family protein n=1 Tax=Acetatifactor sp. TaxID=1872090 RepID=UPI004055B1AB
MQRNRVELLAPAGNMEGFYGAIHAGADAIYLGGSRFGARAYADNFTTEELVSCIRYAHLWERKVYLTVNTLVKESEFPELYDYLLPFYETGLDGVIVQDIGVLGFIRGTFPGMELHVSTQMTLTGSYGAGLLKEMGACRIVPARELSLQEIRDIKEKTGLSIETFIHGAMCYCYSGQCLFSSILGGRSGNRGRCAQPCRLPYEVKVGNHKSGECYPLSLKDMCTIEHIPELIEAGIDSFKIEGRMKKPEYTAGVTAIYRKYIDQYYANPQNYKISPVDMKALSCLYIRSERQDGYYYKHNGKEMVTLDSPAYSGSDEALLAKIRQKYLEKKPKKPIDIYAVFVTGANASLTVVLDNISITVEGDVVQTASKQPISEENIAKQLGKLGDSIFMAEEMSITVSEDAFYPLRAINELRREAIVQLENALLTENGFPVRREDASFGVMEVLKKGDALQGGLCLSVRTIPQLEAVYESLSSPGSVDIWNDEVQNGEGWSGIRRLYVDSDLLLEYGEQVIEKCRKLSAFCELVIALPYIIRSRDYSLLDKKIFPMMEQYEEIFSGMQVRSVEGMGILKSKDYPGKIYADAGFYLWNRRTLLEWVTTLNGACLPLELRGTEQKELLVDEFSPYFYEKIVYGRIPMMITANCVANTTAGCQRQSGERIVELVDRYHKVFPVELNCIHCMNIIYNSVPLSLHGEIPKWKNMAACRLDFTVEDKRQTKEVIKYFTGLLKTKDVKGLKPPYKEYTTGHEKRGVE